jgi:hypothetical protein
MFNFFKKEAFSNAPKELRKLLHIAFPGGEKQVENEANALLISYSDLFTLDSARSLVVWVKSHSLINRSLSYDEMCNAISRHEKHRLTVNQCSDIYTKILTQDFINREN